MEMQGKCIGVGGWRLEVGGWKFEVGGWKFEVSFLATRSS